MIENPAVFISMFVLAGYFVYRFFYRDRPKPNFLPHTAPDIANWKLVNHKEGTTFWRDQDGDVLSLAPLSGDEGFPSLSDINGIRKACRAIAEGSGSGLIEATTITSASGPCILFIYKHHNRSNSLAFVFTGMLVVFLAKSSFLWTVVATERGTTGVREASVTAQLMNEGKLTLESYETSWAEDPYDPGYRGVDKTTLRYISDDESYDTEFPDHPLSKVRRELRKLLNIKLGGPHRYFQ